MLTYLPPLMAWPPRTHLASRAIVGAICIGSVTARAFGEALDDARHHDDAGRRQGIAEPTTHDQAERVGAIAPASSRRRNGK